MLTCHICGTSNDDVCHYKKQGDPVCLKHYRQLMRKGKVYRTIYDKNEIIDCGTYYKMCLYDRNGNIKAHTIFDKKHSDVVSMFKWKLSNGYAYNAKNNILLHRLILNAPDGMEVDHINRDRLNNLDYNLRVCTRLQNAKNIPSNGYRKDGNCWEAYISVNRKRIYLGYFKEKQDAINKRLSAEKMYYGEYAVKR